MNLTGLDAKLYKEYSKEHTCIQYMHIELFARQGNIPIDLKSGDVKLNH